MGRKNNLDLDDDQLSSLINYMLENEYDEDRDIDYSDFDNVDRKFLRFLGINNRKDWESLSPERQKALLKEMHK